MAASPTPPGARSGESSAPVTKVGARNPKARGTLIIAAVVAVWAVLFLLLNRQTVTVHFVVFSTRLALFWALALATASGTVIGLVIARRRRPASS